MLNTDNITVLTTIDDLHLVAKRWLANGEIAGYDKAFNFKLRTVQVAGVHDLSSLLTELEGNPRACIIRGGFIGDELAAPILATTERAAPGCVVRQKVLFKDRRLHMMLIDIDGYESYFADPVHEPIEVIGEFVRTQLPECFNGAAYHWQLSNSAGSAENAGKLKAHLWFWLATPYTSAELRTWVNMTRVPIDAAVFDEIQVHYTAAPAFDHGVVDPVPVRSGFVEGADAVNLVISPEILGSVAGLDTLSRKEVLESAVATDPTAQRLRDLGMVKSARSDGALNIVCPREGRHEGPSNPTATVYYPAFTGGYAKGNFKCMHTACREVDQQEFREEIGLSALDGFSDADAAGTVEAESALADVRISRMLADMLAEKHYLFEHGGRGWLRMQCGVYVTCAKGEVTEEAKLLGGRIMRECTTDRSDSDKVSRLMKLALRAMSAAGIGAALSLAQSDPRLAASPDEFDTDPKTLNVLNGVVDLVTGQLRPHDPATRSSRQCTVVYDPTARAPLWEKFILDVSCDDPEWVDFVCRAMGYTITGEVREEMMFFMIGVGANGKSVFANVIRRILGRYATTVTANFLSQSKRDGEAATPSLATLPGVRMALANEIEAGSKLSAQMVKVATSTEQIAARHNYGSVFNFTPTHKPWVRGNHKPIVADTDEGIWRRLVLIMFDRHFAAHERDGQLEEKLMAEAPGILAWMVRGCLEYRRRGLRPTGRIAQASAAYRQESDLLGQWIEDEAETGSACSVVQGHAYDSYRGWCSSQGLHPIAKKSFTRGLVERGIREAQQTTGARARTYRGLKLKFGFESAQHEQDIGLFSQTLA